MRVICWICECKYNDQAVTDLNNYCVPLEESDI